MFSRFSRIPLRRCLHTAPPRTTPSSFFSRRARAAVGASVVMAAYMTWQLTNESNRIALDAPQPSKATSTTSLQKETRLAEPLSGNDIAPKSESTSVSDEFVPDSPEETSISSPEDESGDSEGEEPSGEGKASSSGAFNPETGEINWDCPCLGGMAHGPCGPEFREAFSCFVYSEAEPKGINCVEKFQNMQNCFRAHPEVYADEIMDDDDDDAPAVSGSSDVPPSEQSDDKLSGDATPSSDAAQTPQIDSTSISSDSSL